MCRWITILSTDTISLADIVLTPSNSLIQVSKDASFHPGATEMNNHVMNGDGFGVGWYHPNSPAEQRTIRIRRSAAQEKEEQLQQQQLSRHAYAAVFRDTQPAWNNANLKELCMAVRSHCVVAHVRAASAFAPVISEQNCHPFKAGRLLFCHNGRIENFQNVRRRVMALCSEEAFLSIRGSTDSECIFALILTYLSEDSSHSGSAFTQTTPFGHKRLSAAMKKVLRAISNVLEDAGIDTGYCTLNFCLTDGDTVVVTRFCDKSPHVPPPSLYFAFGEANALAEELVNEEAQMSPLRHSTSSSVLSSGDEKKDTDSVVSDHSGGSHTDFNEDRIELNYKQSVPGVLYEDVDPQTASCLIASCPLTRTHHWHPMPQNSMLWYTRGVLPELRLLKRRNQKTHSIIFTKEQTAAMTLGLESTFLQKTAIVE